MAFDTRMANMASRMKMKGIVTGKVDRNTRRNTATAPRQSEPSSRARSGGAGSSFSRWRRLSSSAGWSIDATTGGMASAISA